MSRSRTIPDDHVFAATRALLAEQGTVTFGAVAAATGLAASTLAQRYGSVAGMSEAALTPVLARQEMILAKAAAEPASARQGAQDLLKALADSDLAEIGVLGAIFRAPALKQRAEDWRYGVETALAAHLGSADAARMVFAAWQGQALWHPAGGKGFRLKDLVKRLT